MRVISRAGKTCLHRQFEFAAAAGSTYLSAFLEVLCLLGLGSPLNLSTCTPGMWNGLPLISSPISNSRGDRPGLESEDFYSFRINYVLCPPMQM